ncbi:MAG: hypothetical protein IJ468_08295 [Lachnospiraceae bacterium]|nr:hypothetical protein [Lachnospiraceae bacterium]
MPKVKYILFSVVLTGFLLLIGASVVMTYPRYQKTTEQLAELISADTTANPALLKIKEQLDQFQVPETVSGAGSQADEEMKTSSEESDSAEAGAEKTDSETTDSEKMENEKSKELLVWTGSVCASKYMTLSGSETIYYVCPYIIAQKSNLNTAAATDWNFSLRFAVSVLKDGELSDEKTDIQVRNIQFSFRVGEKALISSVGYGDGEMNSVNGTSVSYQFRDRESVSNETSIFARLSLIAVSAAEKEDELKTETAVNNWSFVIIENGREIGIFDDVQIELPYQKTEPVTDSEDKSKS